MRTTLCAGIACLALLTPAITLAQTASVVSESQPEGAVPLTRLIAAVAKKTGRKFIVDPRVRADVLLIGQDPASLAYSDLLEVLRVYGFAAFEGGGYVRVIPDANVRQEAPLVSGKDNHPDADWITKVMLLHSAPAAELVPVLRPLVPQQGHLQAYPCSNALIMTGTAANVREIEAIVATLDTGPPFKRSAACAGVEPSR